MDELHGGDGDGVVSGLMEAEAYYSLYCGTKGSKCYGKYIQCPYECPSSESSDPQAKVCHIDCDQPVCKAVCRSEYNFINFILELLKLN